MIAELQALFLAHPWVPVYGPMLLITVLTYLFKVAARLIRDKRWTWLDRSYFYFGMPFLWASFGRVLALFVNDVSGNGDLDPYLHFLVGWAFCAFFIFVIHATYEVPEAELLDELRFIWEGDKGRAGRMGRGFNDPIPTHNVPAALQRLHLMGVASLIGVVTFVLYDYLFCRNAAVVVVSYV